MNKYLKKTYKEVKGESTGNTLDILAREYFSKSNESRIVLKYDIDEYTNRLDKIGLTSLAITFVIPIINNIFPYSIWIVGCCLAVYIIMAFFIGTILSQYIFLKKYKKIIEDIERGNIIQETINEVKKFKILSNVKES